MRGDRDRQTHTHTRARSIYVCCLKVDFFPSFTLSLELPSHMHFINIIHSPTHTQTHTHIHTYLSSYAFLLLLLLLFFCSFKL
jgi:hypothetical protein